MFAALLTTLLFATSAICAYRTSKQIGGLEANFWRIAIATILLMVWTCAFGTGFAGAPGWFMLSGFFGIGIGDSAYFQALPRLGSRRAVLVCQCLTAPAAALIEWLWLDTKLSGFQMICVAVILTGVAIALAPEDHLKISARDWQIGLAACVTSAAGAALGMVMIRKAFKVAQEAGINPDAGTTGYQRLLGGILFPAAALLIIKWNSARAHGPLLAPNTRRISLEKWRPLWPWVLANALAGQTLGVTCMQWALKTTSAGVVTAIIALTPVVLLPLTWIVEKEKISIRSVVGALTAVAGVIALTDPHIIEKLKKIFP